MYLLNSTLDTIFEKLEKPPQPEEIFVQIPRIYDAHMHCFGDISTDVDQGREKTLFTSYEAPEPKMEFSAPMIMNDVMGEVSMADLEPIQLAKKKTAVARRKADLTTFDREKFYKRIGVKIDESDPEDEVLEMGELSTIEVGGMGLADSEEITLEKVVDINALRKPKADMHAFDYEAFCRRQGL